MKRCLLGRMHIWNGERRQCAFCDISLDEALDWTPERMEELRREPVVTFAVVGKWRKWGWR